MGVKYAFWLPHLESLKYWCSFFVIIHDAKSNQHILDGYFFRGKMTLERLFSAQFVFMNLTIPRFSPTCYARRKAQEILIYKKNVQEQVSSSNIISPLYGKNLKQQKLERHNIL